jgi:Na+-driven multidrug efflux pump
MLPMVVNIVGLVLIRLPVAWMFALPVGLGLAGAWIAKCLSNLVVAGGMVLVCKRSDWLAIKVISKDVVSRDHSGHAHANSFLVDF